MKQTLSHVRSMNAAVWDNVNCRNNGVYCVDGDGSVHRVTQAKTVKGVLMVKTFHGWIVPVHVYKV